MTNEQFVKELGIKYSNALKYAEQLNQTLNEEQFSKFRAIVEFFENYIKDNSGRIESIDLNPKDIHGGITADFIIFNLIGDEIKEFSEVIKNATAFSIDTTKNGKLCISITVPDVFQEN